MFATCETYQTRPRAAYISDFGHFQPFNLVPLDSVCTDCSAKHWESELFSSRSSFVLKVEDKMFKKIRRSAGCLPSLYFSADLMIKFFEYKEKEREEQEEADEILSKIHKKCKKDKNEEGLALVAITRRFVENDSWGSSTTEESFIDQHLLPFVQAIFMNNRTYVHSRNVIRSAGRIPLSNSSHSASDGKDTCSKLKPDFCVMHKFQGINVGLLAIEVKLPDVCSSQALSDRSKLALELKRMVDQQVISGSRDPKSFGVLVEDRPTTLALQASQIDVMLPYALNAPSFLARSMTVTPMSLVK
ncbi:hypothetical protein EDC96DRAFT_543045 [Choanephora cucurbitarum]|nr:hypothetical protein EDC96DRAFT_543045 [Choanephora cucurbitarum]